MFSARDMPSPSSIFSAYASMTASMMLFRSMANDLIPQPLRGYLLNAIRYLVEPRSSTLTLIIEESAGISRNMVYDAAEAYLSSRVTPDNPRLTVTKTHMDKNLSLRLEKGEKLIDVFNAVPFKWRFVCGAESEKTNDVVVHNSSNARSAEKRWFEVTFPKKQKEMAVQVYLPFILERAREMREQQRVLKMHTLDPSVCYSGMKWDSIILDHPSTFETLAMEPEVKNAVMHDLDRFVKRKEFYKRVGRAWKRGYLLYGPPGTGKSSLIAAMANYLKFDIFDLQLGNVVRDSDLRKLLLATANRSILVIEDIDCTVDLPDRRHAYGLKQSDIQITLSGLLNFIDGLWSSCGDERIIIFTTNQKERLDPALLRPGRMDMHIHMSYCSYQGFKLLASNYLQTPSDHPLYGEIEGLIEDIQITPAQVAEELMKDEDAEATLEGFVKLLKRKKMEGDVCQNNNAEPKRSKAGCKQNSKSNIGVSVTQRRTGRTRRGSSLYL